MKNPKIARFSQNHGVQASTNDFYLQNADLISDCLSFNYDRVSEVDEDFYINRRILTKRISRRNRAFKGLDDALQQEINSTDFFRAKIGEPEINLLRFVHSKKSSKVLLLTGNTGTGKSTLLRYFFDVIEPKLKSVTRSAAIVVDGATLPNENICTRHLLGVIVAEFRKVALERELLEDHDRQRLEHLHQSLVDGANLDTELSLRDFFESIVLHTKNHAIPIVVFDNIDHLDTRSISKILSLVRRISLLSGCSTIVAVRPSTSHTQHENFKEEAIYFRNQIEINPPDIRSVLDKRLEMVGKHTGPFSVGSISSIDVGDTRQVLRNLSEKVFAETPQTSLFFGLANDNVRRALKIFDRYLRYRDIPRTWFIPSLSQNPGNGRHSNVTSKILRGIMLSDNFVYNSDDNTDVCNLLFFKTDDYGVVYTVQYKIVLFLYNLNSSFHVSELVSAIMEFGYEYSVVLEATRKLTRDGLIEASSVFSDIDETTVIRISKSGTFYLEKLIIGSLSYDYVINAILDVPIEQRYDDASSHNRLLISTATLLNHLRTLFKIEKSDFDNFRGRIHHSKTNLALMDNFFLSFHLSRVLRRYINIAKKNSAKSYNRYLDKSEDVTALISEIESYQRRAFDFGRATHSAQIKNESLKRVKQKNDPVFRIKYPDFSNGSSERELEITISDKDRNAQGWFAELLARVEYVCDGVSASNQLRFLKGTEHRTSSCVFSIPYGEFEPSDIDKININLFVGAELVHTCSLK